MSLLLLLLPLGIWATVVNGQFEVPDALVEALSPRGLRVSIPDQEGIKLFAFHGKINEEMNGREAGFFSRDIVTAKNGRWTFYEPTAILKPGDTLYYWTYVDYFDGIRKLGYPKDDQKFEVKELIASGTGSTTRRPQSITTTTTRRTPVNPDCEETITTVNSKTTCSGKLIFSENFSTIRPKYWSAEYRFSGDPDYEFVAYLDRPDILKVKNGVLTIKPKLTDDVYGEGFTDSHELSLGDNCTGIQETFDCCQQPTAWQILPPVISAQISTKNKFSFKYGRIEIKAKLPRGDWIYPELFLNPRANEYGPGYESGQIRIAFTIGNGEYSKVLQGGCVLGSTEPARLFYQKQIRRDSGWTNEFHKYSLVWSKDSITVSVDDKVYGNIYPPENGFGTEEHKLNLTNINRLKTGTKIAPFDKDMFIVLGVGVGGLSIPDRMDGSKPWSNNDPKNQKKFYNARSTWKNTWGDSSALEVEYVKVWAL